MRVHRNHYTASLYAKSVLSTSFVGLTSKQPWEVPQVDVRVRSPSTLPSSRLMPSALDDPQMQWPVCPSLPAAIAVTACSPSSLLLTASKPSYTAKGSVGSFVWLQPARLRGSHCAPWRERSTNSVLRCGFKYSGSFVALVGECLCVHGVGTHDIIGYQIRESGRSRRVQ